MKGYPIPFPIYKKSSEYDHQYQAPIIIYRSSDGDARIVDESFESSRDSLQYESFSSFSDIAYRVRESILEIKPSTWMTPSNSTQKAR